MDYVGAIIGVLGTILGGVLSYAAFHRNSKKDSDDIIKSVNNNALPTFKLVYFFKINAIMSVPPDDESLLNIIADPTDVSNIAYTSSNNG